MYGCVCVYECVCAETENDMTKRGKGGDREGGSHVLDNQSKHALSQTLSLSLCLSLFL